MKSASLYVLCDPDGEIRYAGWTSKSPARRLCEHLRDARYDQRPCYRLKWLRSLLSRNLQPIQQVLAIVELEDVRKAEIRLIAALRSRGCRLVNGTDGGDGLINPTPEARANISAARKRWRISETGRANMAAAQRERWARGCFANRMSEGFKGEPRHPGWKHSNETRMKMSLAKRGIRRTPEERAKLSLAMRGRKYTPEHCAAISRGRKEWERTHPGRHWPRDEHGNFTSDKKDSQPLCGEERNKP